MDLFARMRTLILREKRKKQVERPLEGAALLQRLSSTLQCTPEVLVLTQTYQAMMSASISVGARLPRPVTNYELLERINKLVGGLEAAKALLKQSLLVEDRICLEQLVSELVGIIATQGYLVVHLMAKEANLTSDLAQQLLVQFTRLRSHLNVSSDLPISATSSIRATDSNHAGMPPTPILTQYKIRYLSLRRKLLGEESYLATLLGWDDCAAMLDGECQRYWLVFREGQQSSLLQGLSFSLLRLWLTRPLLAPTLTKSLATCQIDSFHQTPGVLLLRDALNTYLEPNPATKHSSNNPF
ncbi:hypothetical protein NEHOM01_0664 [Nematocida homosporus]|uniref:uncharacterized protein n=1 Tax=Nematocida homosporus TaxID=1912981 RepID=UPI0022208FAD|nr:uncharacterized protein NEHOM01_0664 [Nematocida homosporus]KAI5185206.1 hypothetical protein NEHOM01_0664 [Nematocida homosporus]